MLLRHTLSNGALFYPSQGGWFHAEGCVVLPGPRLYIFPHFVGGVLFGDSDRYKWKNKPLSLEKEHLFHRYTVGGTWRGSLPGEFEGNFNYSGDVLRRFWDGCLSLYGPLWGSLGGGFLVLNPLRYSSRRAPEMERLSLRELCEGTWRRSL